MLDLRTIRETARELGTKDAVISGLLEAWGTTTYPVPRNGKARGIDRDTFRRLKRALRKSEPELAATE